MDLQILGVIDLISGFIGGVKWSSIVIGVVLIVAGARGTHAAHHASAKHAKQYIVSLRIVLFFFIHFNSNLFKIYCWFIQFYWNFIEIFIFFYFFLFLFLFFFILFYFIDLLLIRFLFVFMCCVVAAAIIIILLEAISIGISGPVVSNLCDTEHYTTEQCDSVRKIVIISGIISIVLCIACCVCYMVVLN